MIKLLGLRKSFTLGTIKKSCFSTQEQILLYDKFKGFQNNALNNLVIPGVTIANTREKAIKALEVLKSIEDRPHAWDTETIDLEAKEESPVGRGRIICATAFCGPEVDFGTGPRLFLDNFGTNHDNIMLFKEYFENSNYKKVWHNYGFDRHILYNHGINAKGFGGDTMHMARLYDSSMGPKGYSLANLTVSLEKKILETKTKIISFLEKELEKDEQSYKTLQMYKKCFLNTNYKKSMYKLFGRRKTLKSGGLGKTVEIPPIIDLHTREDTILEWVNYSCLDAEITFFLRETLVTLLNELGTNFEGMKNMYDVYQKYWLPFGEMLTDMERIGIKVNKEHLQKITIQAQEDMQTYHAKFMELVLQTQEDAEEFNPSSTLQLQQLLYAPFTRAKVSKPKTDDDAALESLEPAEDGGVNQEEEVYGDEEPKRKVNRTEVNDFPEVKVFQVPNTKGIILPGKKAPLKHRDMTIRGFGIPPPEITESGLPSVDTNSLKILAGKVKDKKYGTAFDHLKYLESNLFNFSKQGKGELGVKICEALNSLIQFRAIETLLQTFIIPLQELPDQNDRIHSSLNIFTETGRLASRRPNLQNQPALEKDKYKIRLSFIPEKGKKFIVADYGQLELRLLAHMTNCQSMLHAFKSGGDFHSRTAMVKFPSILYEQGMYPEIKKEVDSGEVLLEWDSSKGAAPKPLIKDKYASERKKAKGMNFSIAYGKSAHGFAKDWGCTIEEAQEALDAWYNDRKEVKEWQDKTKQIALSKGWTQTLIGRYRNLSKILKNPKRGMVSHALRASINTPIQGGAADLVIAAMVKIHQNKELREMGWNCLLQIHDEVILEGPEETAEKALKIMLHLMENPFEEPLRVPLEISADICNNWYEAK